jgi:hypothetical protein
MMDDDECGVDGVIGMGNPSTRRKSAPVSLFHHKSHMTWSGIESGPRSGKPATNLLSYGTAYVQVNTEYLGHVYNE